MEVEISPGMDKEEEAKLECRACLELFVGTENLYNLFLAWSPPWKGMHETIAEDLTRLTDIKVSENDQFSPAICGVCCKKLKDACTFIHDVQHNDSILKQRHAGTSYTWPKPIQLAKNVNDDIFDTCDKDIKEEANSDYENDVSFAAGDSVADVDEYNLDIKLEPEEQSEIVVNDTSNSSTVDGITQIDDESDPLSLQHNKATENIKQMQKNLMFCVDLTQDVNVNKSFKKENIKFEKNERVQNFDQDSKFNKYIHKYFASRIRGADTMLPPCSCTGKCYKNISNQQRNAIFKHFWDQKPENQWELVINFTTKNKVLKNKGKSKDGDYFYEYFLPTTKDFSNTGNIIKVCKRMFVNTLSCTRDINKRAWGIYEQAYNEHNEMSVAAEEFVKNDNTDSIRSNNKNRKKLTCKDKTRHYKNLGPPANNEHSKMSVHVEEFMKNDNTESISLNNNYRKKLTFKDKTTHNKNLGPPCACKFACYEKVSEEQRKCIFEYFWNLGTTTKQWTFVIQNTRVRKPTVKSTNRWKNFRCSHLLPSEINIGESLKKVRVCKVMFQNTLAVGSSIALLAWKKYEQGQVLKDKRNINKKYTATPDEIQSVRDHLATIRKLKRNKYERLVMEKMFTHYLMWFDPSKYERKVINMKCYKHLINKIKYQEATENFELLLYRKSEECETSNYYLKNEFEMETIQLSNDFENSNDVTNLYDSILNNEDMSSAERRFSENENDSDGMHTENDNKLSIGMSGTGKRLIVTLTKLKQDESSNYICEDEEMARRPSFSRSKCKTTENKLTKLTTNTSDSNTQSSSKDKSIWVHCDVPADLNAHRENQRQNRKRNITDHTIMEQSWSKPSTQQDICITNLKKKPSLKSQYDADATSLEQDSCANIELGEEKEEESNLTDLEYDERDEFHDPDYVAKNLVYDSENEASDFDETVNEDIGWIDDDLRSYKKARGLQYMTRSGKIVKARKLGPVCDCQKKCGTKISREQREMIFTHYWSLGDRAKQRIYVTTYTEQRAQTTFVVNSHIKRSGYTLKYYLPLLSNSDNPPDKIMVCQKMFENTLSCPNNSARTAWKRLAKDQKRQQKIKEKFATDTEVKVEQYNDKIKNMKTMDVECSSSTLLDGFDYDSDPDSYDCISNSNCPDIAEHNRINNSQNDPSSQIKTEIDAMPVKMNEYLRKCNKRLGKTYINSSGKIIPEKKMGPPCGCQKYDCGSKISEDQRKKIFDYYWSLGDLGQQSAFIIQMSSQNPPSSRVTVPKTGLHEYIYKYFLPKSGNMCDKIAVCKKMFERTISCRPDTVKSVWTKLLKDKQSLRTIQGSSNNFTEDLEKMSESITCGVTEDFTNNEPLTRTSDDEQPAMADMNQLSDVEPESHQVNTETPSLTEQEQREMMYMLATQLGYLSNYHPNSVTMRKYYSKKKIRCENEEVKKAGTRNKKLIKFQNRLSGKEYITAGGKLVKEKMPRPPCYCSLFHCADKLNEVQRMYIFKYYWSIECRKKRIEFVKNLTVKSAAKRQRVNAIKPSRSTYKYFLPISKDLNGERVMVCQNMFMSTLALPRSTRLHRIEYVEEKKNTEKLHPDVKSSVKDHVFLLLDLGFNLSIPDYNKMRSEGIPCVKAMTYHHMHELYLKWFDPNKYKAKADKFNTYKGIARRFVSSKEHKLPK